MQQALPLPVGIVSVHNRHYSKLRLNKMRSQSTLHSRN